MCFLMPRGFVHVLLCIQCSFLFSSSVSFHSSFTTQRSGSPLQGSISQFSHLTWSGSFPSLPNPLHFAVHLAYPAPASSGLLISQAWQAFSHLRLCTCSSLWLEHNFLLISWWTSYSLGMSSKVTLERPFLLTESNVAILSWIIFFFFLHSLFIFPQYLSQFTYLFYAHMFYFQRQNLILDPSFSSPTRRWFLLYFSNKIIFKWGVADFVHQGTLPVSGDIRMSQLGREGRLLAPSG